MRKLLSIGIIFLLLSLAYFQVHGNRAKTSIITVDNEGDGDYTFIKEALKNANSGDVIEVYSGTYYEHNITVTKPEITLKGIPYELGSGYDTGKPFIHGQGLYEIIIVRADNIAITGFAMENSGTTRARYIIEVRNCNNCLISNNNISHSVMACIACRNSSNNKIVGNTINHSLIRQGVMLSYSGGMCVNNTVADNIITNVSVGIHVWDSHYNIISGNKISRCWHGVGLTVGDNNEIFQNNFKDNTAGVYIASSSYNLIAQNNFINNKVSAFFLHSFPPYDPLPPYFNMWIRNYWDDWFGIGPKIIFGRILYFLPWIDFDLFPVLRPYEW